MYDGSSPVVLGHDRFSSNLIINIEISCPFETNITLHLREFLSSSCFLYLDMLSNNEIDIQSIRLDIATH